MGNRLSDLGTGGITDYTYDDANRLTTINGSISYTWDDNGNLVDNGQGSTYSYDAANRLVDLANDALAFSYDGLGNRMTQVFEGLPITYTNDIAGDLSQVLVETTDTGATTYLYGLNRIAQQSPASTDYFLGDALDSVRQLADASGAVIMTESYELYGALLDTTGSATTTGEAETSIGEAH